MEQKQIEFVHAEKSTYDQLIRALDSQFHGKGQQIFWEDGYAKSVRLGTLDIDICATSNKRLINMGFADKFVYDAIHFQETMFPNKRIDHDPYGKEHGHNSTLADLERLPSVINKPMMILTTRSDDEPEKRGRLMFLRADQQNGHPVYSLAVVQPFGLSRSSVEPSSRCSRVVTYYNLSNYAFNKLLTDVENDKRQVVYFSQAEYARAGIVGCPKLDSMESIAFKLDRRNANEQIRGDRVHQDLTADAIEAHLSEFALGSHNLGYFHGFAQHTIETLQSPYASLEEVLQARVDLEKLIDKAISSADNHVLVAAREKADQIVMQCIDQQLRQESVLTQDDIDRLYDDVIPQIEQMIQTKLPGNKELLSAAKLTMGDTMIELEDKIDIGPIIT